MIFDIQYKEPKVYDGYSIASEILSGTEIIERLNNVVKLTYTQVPSRVAALMLAQAKISIIHGAAPKIPVKDYWYDSPRVNATTIKGDPAIYINRRNVPYRTVETYIRNGAHELGHIIGFGHGSNWTQDTWKGRMMCRISGDKEDKEQSVPYMLEKLVIQLAIEKVMIKVR